MKNKTKFSLTIMLLAALGYGSSVIAADTLPDWTLNYPAGIACDFPLRIDGWNGKADVRETKDKNGFVRVILAGQGGVMLFTNLDIPSRTFSTKANGGAGQTTTYKQDGSFAITNTGHSILILWPTDIPAGPSTTLIVGKVSLTSDKDFNFNVTDESGNKTDICAILN